MQFLPKTLYLYPKFDSKSLRAKNRINFNVNRAWLVPRDFKMAPMQMSLGITAVTLTKQTGTY